MARVQMVHVLWNFKFSMEVYKTMWVQLFLTALLFYVFVPGVLLNLSTPFSSPAVTHAVLFALVGGFVMRTAKGMLAKL